MLISGLEMFLSNSFIYFSTSFTAIDERSGSGSWGSAEQDSPSFSQGRVGVTRVNTHTQFCFHLYKVHVNVGDGHIILYLENLALTPGSHHLPACQH